MVNLSELSPKKGARRKKTRLGLGYASGKGRACTKGQKGQTSRSGNTRKESSEGGQMPLFRRIPKSGFSNVRFSNKYECVNLKSLEKFTSTEEITPETLKKAGLVKHTDRVKILADGDIKSAIKIKAHSFSSSARSKIEAAGGTVTVIKKEETKSKGVKK